MLNHFYVRLVHDDLAKRYIQCRSMHVMAGIFLIFYAAQQLLFQPIVWSQVAMIGIPAIMTIAVSIFSKKNIEHAGNNSIFRILEIGFLCMGAEYFHRSQKDLLAFLFICIAFFISIVFWMEHRLFSKQFVDFYEDTIIIPGSLRDKKIKWQQLNKVIINHDYLTLEYKNNQFYQHRIHDSFSEDERLQFKEFCLQKIKQSV